MRLTKEQYITIWGGTVNNDTIDRALMLSEDMLQNITLFDISSVGVNIKLDKAICAQAEYLMTNGLDIVLNDTVLKSVSLEGYSYSQEQTSDTKSKICNMARGYMEQSGLLYRGLI